MTAIAISYGQRTPPVAQHVVELAENHGLLCHDQQGPDVYLLSHMKPKRQWLQFSVMSTPNFDAAEGDFQRFSVTQGYPATLLWTAPGELIFWRGRFLVLDGDAGVRRERAKTAYEIGAARNVGIMIDGNARRITSPFAECISLKIRPMLNTE